MRIIVLDTSVFVSASFRTGSASRAALRLCLERRCMPLMAEALYAEYEAVLGRERLFRDCALDERERASALAGTESAAVFLAVEEDAILGALAGVGIEERRDGREIRRAEAGDVIIVHGIKRAEGVVRAVPKLQTIRVEQVAARQCGEIGLVENPL